MAIFLKDLIDNPKLLTNEPSSQGCSVCHVPLQETITGKRRIDQGYACSDCYYAELGEELAKHPIVSGGIRRG